MDSTLARLGGLPASESAPVQIVVEDGFKNGPGMVGHIERNRPVVGRRGFAGPLGCPASSGQAHRGPCPDAVQLPQSHRWEEEDGHLRAACVAAASETCSSFGIRAPCSSRMRTAGYRSSLADVVLRCRKSRDVNVGKIVTRRHTLFSFRIQKSRSHRMSFLQTVNNVFRS